MDRSVDAASSLSLGSDNLSSIYEYENFKPLHMTSFSKNDKRYEEMILICSSTSNFFEIRRQILLEWVRIKSLYKSLRKPDKT